MSSIGIPLADCADEWIRQLARATGAAKLIELSGETLLGERAALANFNIPGRLSAGGGCRLYDSQHDRIALNLSRTTDRELLPALFEVDGFDIYSDDAIATQIAGSDARALLERGRLMGLAIAAEHEHITTTHACVELTEGVPRMSPQRTRPRVIDLSALWAGPLSAHLLWLADADVIKVESRSRPDAMRDGDQTFFALLNQSKASVVLDLTHHADRQALLNLISDADIVIEAARPRALLQLGIDAEQLVRNTPGLTWITITGHGALDEPANWVGFGDDCGIAGGLSAALLEATGSSGFVGDAIADPLTGIYAANVAWRSWHSQRGGHFGIAMSHVVAEALAWTSARDAMALNRSLKAWHAAVGQPFPVIDKRAIGHVAAFGADTHTWCQHGSRPC